VPIPSLTNLSGADKSDPTLTYCTNNIFKAHLTSQWAFSLPAIALATAGCPPNPCFDGQGRPGETNSFLISIPIFKTVYSNAVNPIKHETNSHSLMTALTVYYGKDPREVLLVTDYPAKFVEYSDAQQRKPYHFFPGYASMYLLPLLYATRILKILPRGLRPSFIAAIIK